MSSKVTEEGVIPDVLDAFTPIAELKIVFSGPNKTVNYGELITPVESAETPVVAVKFLEEPPAGSRFSLVETDPDAPSRTNKISSEVAHYFVTDIPLDTSKQAVGEWQSVDVTKSKTLLTYVAPRPPPKTGLHRYVFILYASAPDVKITAPASESRRNWGSGIPGFGVRDYFKKEIIVAQPLAVNFFHSQNDQQ